MIEGEGVSRERDLHICALEDFHECMVHEGDSKTLTFVATFENNYEILVLGNCVFLSICS